MKQVDYSIVEAVDVPSLRKYVKNRMLRGWVCLGGVRMFKREYDPHQYYYFQTMVKEEE